MKGLANREQLHKLALSNPLLKGGLLVKGLTSREQLQKLALTGLTLNEGLLTRLNLSGGFIMVIAFNIFRVRGHFFK